MTNLNNSAELMNDFNHELVAPANAIDWREAVTLVDALLPGDVINGFDELTDINILIANIGNHYLGNPINLEIPSFDPRLLKYDKFRKRHQIPLPWHKSSSTPSMEILEEGFRGTFDNLAVTIQDTTDLETVAFRTGKSVYELPQLMGFIISGDMLNQTKKVADISIFCNLGVKGNRIAASYERLMDDTANRFHQSRVVSSAQNAGRILAHSAQNPYSAGLPTLGKRR